MINVDTLVNGVIKDSNKKKILNIIYKKQELTIKELAKKAKISIPTSKNNVNELIEEGLVELAGVAESSGGRKPVIVRFIKDARFSFGVDILVGYYKIILTNINSDILWETKIKQEDYLDFDKIIKTISEKIDNIIDVMKIDKNKVLGVGFSLPGTVDEENLLLKYAPNIETENIDFNPYRDYFDFPIYIENEANTAAYGETYLGIAKNMTNLVYLSINEGVGTGIIIAGNLYKGKNKNSGEFGHTVVKYGGKLCRCGRKGCFEKYGSVTALLEDYNSRATESIENIWEFKELLDKKQEIALEVWDEYLNYLSMGISNIIMILDPNYIILGGQLSWFEKELSISIKEKLHDDITQNKILISQLKENSSILGASLLPFQKMFFINEKII